ncbi:heavy metal transporter, partial [Streptomyces sp. NPDC056670]
AEHKKNAATIYSVGKQLGASTRDCIIAIMTAMQESGLKNLKGGDRDSLGLFQQRPSKGWGTPEQIMNPEYASKKFYEALFKIKNRNSLELTVVCQKVQRSAFPTAYAKHE